MATFEEFLASDFDTLDHANLLTGSSRLRNAYLDVLGESKERQTQLQRLQDEQRVCSFPLSDSSIDPRPNWTRAELDDPEDHGRRGRDKHPTVITYEQGHDSCLKAINRKTLLKGLCAIDICYTTPLSSIRQSKGHLLATAVPESDDDQYF
jgi:hypothetical protein